MNPNTKFAGRTVRGILATLALCVNAFFALFSLVFVCCSSPSLEQRMPPFLGAICGCIVAILSIPPITNFVRRFAWRWVASIFVLGAFGFIAFIVSETGIDFSTLEEAIVALGLISTAICALYVIFRVLFFRGH